MVQLSLFRPVFDETRAHWNKISNTVRYCRIKAYVPGDAKSHLETEYHLNERNPKVQYQTELWEHVALAIWRAKGCEWEKAINLLEQHREGKKPIEMLIYSDEIKCFANVEVVEYLESG